MKKQMGRSLAGLCVAAFAGVTIALASSPSSADSTRKTMSSSRKTMSNTRSEMQSTRRTGASSEVKRGASSSTSSSRGGYSSVTRRESALKSGEDAVSPTVEPETGRHRTDFEQDSGVDGDWLEEYRADRADGKERKARESYHNRTLGRSCIMGAGGRVLYRPPGAVCAGNDAPASSGRQPAARAPAQAPAAPAPPRAKPSIDGCAGRCMYGPGGRVIYAPAGCGC